MMAPRDVKPRVAGFPGLPPWLDQFKVRAYMEKRGISEEHAKLCLKQKGNRWKKRVSHTPGKNVSVIAPTGKSR